MFGYIAKYNVNGYYIDGYYIIVYNLPIMPALCSKLAYYAGIMLDALACLLCLKLCRHNMLRPNTHTHTHT